VDPVPLPADRSPLRATVVVRNPNGLHMRPAMAFAKLAGKYRVTVKVRKQDRAVDGKSGMSLMLLAAMPGTELCLEVDGEDAATALPVLTEALGSPSAEGLDALLN
jgi:phosphotransferase system HPr (HPr) family protein